MSALEWKPETALQLSQMLAENHEGPRVPLVPVGGKTALPVEPHTAHSGARPVLMENLNRVIDYPARDMTITVEAGMRVSDLQNLLAVEHQHLPVEVPRADQATIGGAISTNTSGPARFGFGTFRDYVIGISAVDGQGRLFSAGGRVVKNVAGYDLCKLLIGSWGTLAIITQVTLKLMPRPQSKALVLVSGVDIAKIDEVLAALNLSATRPVVIDLLNAPAIQQIDSQVSQSLPSTPYLLCIGYAGSTAETVWQTEAVLRELESCGVPNPEVLTGDNAVSVWNGLVEFQANPAAALTFQVSIPPTKVAAMLQLSHCDKMAMQVHAGNGIVMGQLHESKMTATQAVEPLQTLQEFAQTAGGSMTPYQYNEEWRTVAEQFHSPLRGESLMKQIKQVFDPAGVLNPGRF